MTSFSRLLSLAQDAPAGGSEPFRPKVPESDSFWQPLGASNFAEHVDWLYAVMYWVSVVAFVGVVGVMALFVLKYRAKSRKENEVGDKTATHNTPLEIGWSIPPLIIMMAFFVWGFKGFVDMRTPPKDALEIHATARQWTWEFAYPNGGTDSKLHVPVNRDVRILIQSTDVLHSLYIPAFRVKMDAVPGRYTDLWFRATTFGKYPIFCTEYCGTAHSDMLSEATVESQSDFEKYLDGIGIILEGPELGEKLYTSKGCKACHSTDGSRLVGPTWKGIFGKTEKMADGSSVTVDENYLKESILQPSAKVVEGFPPTMPTYQGQLDDKQIDGLIAYIKSLK